MGFIKFLFRADLGTTLDQRFLRNVLKKSGFHTKKAWIYGFFRVKTTLDQRFLSVRLGIFRAGFHIRRRSVRVFSQKCTR